MSHDAEMDAAMARIGVLRYRLEQAEAENARLKAEVERLTERLGGVRLIVTEEMYDELNTKYLEQQHELQNIALTARQILDEKIDLKEQVERLTKAGDAMVDMVDWEVPYERRKKLEADWNAAKEGKQS
jgi:chromosome segregation ATPase